MPKKIIIRENQLNKLLEAMRPEFRLDNLRSMSFKDKVAYCKQMLGGQIGNGSSRMVFQIDDETVLKLAKNRKGIAQNEREIEFGHDNYMGDCFPKVFNGSDEENYLWIVSEFVLPAKEKDFMEVANMDFKDVDAFIGYVYADDGRYGSFMQKQGRKNISSLYDKYDGNDEATEILNNIHELYYGYDMEIGDFRFIQNWGMVMRDGQPTLVILDSGFSQEINKQYYMGR